MKKLIVFILVLLMAGSGFAENLSNQIAIEYAEANNLQWKICYPWGLDEDGFCSRSHPVLDSPYVMINMSERIDPTGYAGNWVSAKDYIPLYEEIKRWEKETQ